MDKAGLLTYGFDELNTMITWYHYPYQKEHLIKLGLELVDMPISKLLDFFKQIKLKGEAMRKSQRLLKEIISRLEFSKNVGLGYLTLNRKSNSLSWNRKDE